MRLCLSITSLAVTAASGVAAPVTVVNPGFEDTTGSVQTFNEFSFGAPVGWQAYEQGAFLGVGNGPTYWIGTLAPAGSTFFSPGQWVGNRVGIAFNFLDEESGDYGMQQTLSATLQPNTTYTLEVDIGNIASGTDQFGNDYDLSGFPGYRVDLLAGTILLASDNNTLAGLIAEGEFATSTLVYNSPALHDAMNQPLVIRLVNLNEVDPTAEDAAREVDFDNVRLDATPVPEPVAIAPAMLLALGMIRRRA